MTRGGDGEHDLGTVLRDPSQHEESSARIVPIEPFEERRYATR